MKTTIGVMGSANKELLGAADSLLHTTALHLGRAIAARDLILMTGATTGVVYATGKAASEAGAFHVGVSPAANLQEHVERYELPVDACNVLIYTGFGLKGRNVILVRACDVVLFIAGAMGSLNEFTIAHDEGKIIGCLAGTGGVADQVDYLLEKFSKRTGAQIFKESDPERLIDACLEAFSRRQRDS